MQGGGMASSPMVNGSPARASPVSQQSPMGGQPGMGHFPQGNQGINAIMSGLTPQQQAQLQNLPPQQRQLFLMQQQQNLMRASQGQMNNQMMAQQRMGQSGSTVQGGMGMGMSPMDPNAIPALRSNPAMPGIARSTRTPSDHAPSPMTPQLGQGAQDYQRAMLAQQQQQQHQVQRGMSMSSHPMANSNLSGGMTNNPNWQQMGSPLNPQIPSNQDHSSTYGMSPTGSAGQGSFGGGMNGINPAMINQNWNGMNGGGQFSLGMDSPAGSQASVTSNPQQQMAAGSPSVQNGMSDFNVNPNDVFWQ